MNEWGKAGLSMAAGAANGAIGQIFGLIAGGAQDRRQLKQAEKLQNLQMQGQKEMGVFNRQQAMQMWKDTNASAQMEEYRKAGLNPGLMYGGGGAGGATASTPPGSVSGQSAGDPNAGVGMGIQIASQLALQKAQKENIEADTANKKAETGNTELNTDTLQKSQESIIDKAHKEALIAGEEWTKRGAESQEANRGLEDRLKTIKANAIGAILENELTKAKTAVNKEEVKAISERIAQGWEGLKQGDQKIAIDRFKSEIEANYPGISSILGRIGDDAIEKLFNLRGGRPTMKNNNYIK